MPTPVLRVFFQEDFQMVFENISLLLKGVGYFCINPGSNFVYCYDRVGERSKISEFEFSKSILYGKYFGVQFWRATDDDLYVSWDCGEDSIIEFCIFLNGVDKDLRLKIIQKFAALIFCEKITPFEGVLMRLDYE